MSDPTALEGLPENLDAQLAELTPLIIGNKIKEQQVLAASSAAGGPTTGLSAVQILLERAKLGVRELAHLTGLKRKKLQQMLSGEVDLPMEVHNQIIDAIEKKRPGMIEELRNKVFDD